MKPLKVLAATADTQGHRPNDFCWTTDGELVTFPALICDRDLADPDNGCGCGRAWSGTNSHRATTTVMVREIADYTLADYIEAIRSSREQQGWPTGNAYIAGVVADLLEAAESYPAGTILEIRSGEVQSRDWRTPSAVAL